MNSHPEPEPRIAVIGLGNPLMGDDGFGLAVLDRLRAEWEFDASVELVDGGTWGLSLLPVIERADHLLLLDAIRMHKPPGSIIMLHGDDVPRVISTKLSPHQIDMREVLALAHLRGRLPSRLIALGVEPEVVDLQDGLSSRIRPMLDSVVALAVDRLRAWGARCAVSPVAVS